MPRFLGPMPNTWLHSLISNSFVRPWVVLICLLNSTLLGIDFPYEARVTKLEDLNHNVKRVRMRLVNPEGFGFKPGQFVFLKIPDNHVREWNQKYQTSHKNISRPYSFASSPRRLPLFDFIIKLAAAPRGKDVPPGRPMFTLGFVLAIWSGSVHLREVSIWGSIRVAPLL